MSVDITITLSTINNVVGETTIAEGIVTLSGYINVAGSVGTAVDLYVAASDVLADNKLIRGNGGSRNVHDSGITVDDSDNIEGVADLSINSLSIDNATFINVATGAANNDKIPTQGYVDDNIPNITSGVKTTGVDAGILNQLSIDNDWMYVCVIGGAIGVAVWKKALLFKTS